MHTSISSAIFLQMVKKVVDYSTLKVTELKALLEKRGLSASGTKATLISRLQAEDNKKSKETKKKVVKEESDEEVDASEEEKPKRGRSVKPAKKDNKKKVTKKDESDEEASEEEKPKRGRSVKPKKETKKKVTKKEESDEDVSAEEEKPKRGRSVKPKKETKKKVSKKVESDEEEEASEEEKPKRGRSTKPAKKEEVSEEDQDEESEKKDDDQEEEDEISEEKIEMKPVKIPKGVNVTDEEFTISGKDLIQIVLNANEENEKIEPMLNAILENLQKHRSKGRSKQQKEAEKDEADDHRYQVHYNEEIGIYTDEDEKWAFLNAVVGRVKGRKVVPLNEKDVKDLQNPPIKNLGVLPNATVQEYLFGKKEKRERSKSKDRSKSKEKEEKSEGDDDGQEVEVKEETDIVDQVEEGIEEMIEEPEITEDEFMKFVKAQEVVEQKTDFTAIAKEAGIEEKTSRNIMLRYEALKEKFAKALTQHKTKKTDGKKIRRK